MERPNITGNLDVYEGWIVAFIDGVWRKVHLAPGYCTIAKDLEPNEHLGLFRLEDALAGNFTGEKLAYSRYALTGPEIIDADILDRIATVRFGRTKRLDSGAQHLLDGEVCWHIGRNLDDKNGIDPTWPRASLPDRPERWDRTPRSLIVS